ncbi:MAG TPA: monooxygenase [Actinomycetes bacterium]|nr:monooxygenase [Actinomycetes bacterium]
MGRTPDLVTLHLWGVPTSRVPGALLRMGLHRRPLCAPGGPAFAKLLGTGDGRTFTVRDADPHHWGLLATWDSTQDAGDFERGPVARSWARIASERLRVDLRPLTSRGRWSGQQPFGDPVPSPYDGPVAAVTRARIAPRRIATFWRSVPPVSADLHRSQDLRMAVGIGEAPIGLQGTFSLWDSPAALTEFAHRRSPHVEAVRRTAELGWYVEELFARFEVLGVEGTFQGLSP